MGYVNLNAAGHKTVTCNGCGHKRTVNPADQGFTACEVCGKKKQTQGSYKRMLKLKRKHGQY